MILMLIIMKKIIIIKLHYRKKILYREEQNI